MFRPLCVGHLEVVLKTYWVAMQRLCGSKVWLVVGGRDLVVVGMAWDYRG
jgi:hypothetical protein